jgi:putative endonuclease
VELLQHHDYTIQAQNWHCPEGEVDIVAVREGEWFFIEVRTRRGRAYGTPEQSITPRKRARMEAVARRYLGMHLPDCDVCWHLGFAAVEMDRGGRLLRITVYPDLQGPPLRDVET